MRRGVALAAVFGMLASCALQPLKHTRADVEAADLEFEFTLPDAERYSSIQLEAKELARWPEVDKQCATPAADQFTDGLQRNLGGALPHEPAFVQARAVAALTAKRMGECLERLGLVGGAYVVMPSGRVSLPAYVDAIKAIADRQRSSVAATAWTWNAAWFLGCGTRGGPGWRRPDGKCASWRD